MEQQMDLFQWLAWIFQSGGSILIASWVLERIPAYVSIPIPDKKKFIFWGLSFFLSAIAFAGVTYIPREILEAIAPYFGFAYGTFASIFAGEILHFLDKSKNKLG